MNGAGHRVGRTSMLSIGLGIALVLILLSSLLIGPVWIAPWDVLQGLFSSSEEPVSIIVQEIRFATGDDI